MISIMLSDPTERSRTLKSLIRVDTSTDSLSSQTSVMPRKPTESSKLILYFLDYRVRMSVELT
jgi:hypothetical protein